MAETNRIILACRFVSISIKMLTTYVAFFYLNNKWAWFAIPVDFFTTPPFVVEHHFDIGFFSNQTSVSDI